MSGTKEETNCMDAQPQDQGQLGMVGTVANHVSLEGGSCC